jgi:DNA-binding GntR family transcriptional regulator
VHEVLGLRLIVEPAAVELAAGHVDAERIRNLDRMCNSVSTSQDLTAIRRFLRLNHEFHSAVAHASGNPRLAEIVDAVLEEGQRIHMAAVLAAGRGDSPVHEHGELVDALTAGDGPRAREIARAQTVQFRDRVLKALLASPSLMGAELVVTR